MSVDGADRLTWRRGFVEAVRCNAELWLRCGVAVRRRNPIRAVTLTECERLTRNHWYAMMATLGGLRGLTLVGDNGLHAIWLRTFLPGVQIATDML